MYTSTTEFEHTVELHNSNLHAVFATTADSKTFRVSDPLSWDEAQREWAKLADLRLDGRLPHVKFFEVRCVFLGPDRPLVGPEVRSHDRYDKAPLSLSYARPVVAGSRGHKKVEHAARAAWKLFAPTFRSWWDKRQDERTDVKREAAGSRTGVQGTGGWFYYPNGTTAAQGLNDLARVAQRRGLVVQGVDGRWYVVDTEVL